MRPITFILGFACLLAAACGGDKAPETSNNAPGAGETASEERLVSTNAVLENAARNAQAVESFLGELSMEMDFGGMRFGFDGTLTYRAPDATHLQMSMLGMDLEMLVYGENIYAKTANSGWMTFDLTAVGVDLTQLKNLEENKGFFDLEELAKSLGDVEQLDDEAIGGKTYHRYHAEPSFDDLISQLPDGFLDPAISEQAEQAIRGVVVDMWIDPETDLPRRFEMTMSMDLPTGQSGDLTMTFDYLEYNTAVDIPAEPVGAPAFNPGSLGS